VLDVIGQKDRFCDGRSRRSFLRAGFLGLAGLSLADVLRVRAAQPRSQVKDTSVILVWLGGGPSQLDMWDLKPNAPEDIRGEFHPIATDLKGCMLSEHLPFSAQQMRHCALLRSLTHGDADHASAGHYLLTGYEPTTRSGVNEMPSYGSIVAKECGARQRGLPAYVAIPEPPGCGKAAYLGAAYDPFAVGGDPSEANYSVRDVSLPGSLSIERINDRRALLKQLDTMRRDADRLGPMNGLDIFQQQAVEMVASPHSQRAFDLSRETEQTRDRYGRTSFGQSMLLARRLTEAGVTFVTVKNNGWDTHNHNFTTLRDQKLPELDRPWAALVEDLHERGMMDRTLVILMGEFGRSWFVTRQTSGREHWPQCYSAIVAGGGLRMGQVIGASDSRAAYPADRPIKPEDLLATMYHVLGVDPDTTYLTGSNRPIKVLNTGRPIAELIG
jgi:pimeloyl-ACP methyl ester carboxylesterase